MSISAKQLADMLGVSTSAVSLALNGKPGISEETRKTIIDAAKFYGLKSRKKKELSSNFINLIIYKKHGMVYGTTEFFTGVMEGATYQATKLGFNLQISYFYANQSIEDQLQLIHASSSAGIILLATEMLEEDIKYFKNIHRPLVVLDSNFTLHQFSSVSINNYQGAYMAAEHLISKGHKRLGILASSVVINNFTERHEGFTKAVATHLDCSCEMIPVSSTTDGAYTDMSAYLDGNPKLPTALFADNDIIAVSCIRALKEHGYILPDDISVMGFDDIPVLYVTSPKLTTIHVPKEQLGQLSVLILSRILNEGVDYGLKVKVGTTLVERDSVKKL